MKFSGNIDQGADEYILVMFRITITRNFYAIKYGGQNILPTSIYMNILAAVGEVIFAEIMVRFVVCFIFSK